MKKKLPIYPLIAGIVWAACMGLVVLSPTLLSGAQGMTVEQARQALLESQEQLAIAKKSSGEKAKQQLNARLAETKQSLSAFSCPYPDESKLIFQIGQMAHTLQLENFTTRFPGNAPEKILEKENRTKEGWLTVEFDADYLKTIAFVNSLERHKPILFVESIHLRRNPDNHQTASVRMMLSYLIQTHQMHSESDGSQSD